MHEMAIYECCYFVHLFNWTKDIHTANERRLCEIIGQEIGGKLHTARSRNDQVQTDVHLWLRKGTEIIQRKILGILSIIANHASQHIDLLMPSYTHLQPAQIIRYRKRRLAVCQYLYIFHQLYKVIGFLIMESVCDNAGLGSTKSTGNIFK